MKKTNLVLVLLFFISGSFLFAQALGPQPMANHTVGLNSDGTVYTWGYNSFGQLGDNSTTQRNTPIKVLKGAYSGTTNLGDDPNNKIIAVALGYYHSVALAADGTVYTWGYNNYGGLGDGTEDVNRLTPVKVLKGAYSGTTYLGDDSNNKITAVALGSYHSVALAEDGMVYTWGYNGNGQLGDNSTTQRNTPIKVLAGAYSGTYLGDDSNNKITAVALGDYHSVALAADGTVYTWGYNDQGQLGDNTEDTDRLIPVKVLKGAYSEGTTYLGDDSNNKITAVALNNYHSVALAEDGTVYTWGGNNQGQLGDNSTTQRNTPIKVLKGAYSGTTYLGDNSGNKITAVALGYLHSVALAADGTVYTWGGNGDGQLGDNSTTQRNTPIKVLKGAYSGTTNLGDDPNNKIIAVALGLYHSVALAANATVYTWGYNNYGGLGDGTEDVNRLTPVKVVGEGGTGDLALPVTLVSFTANCQNGNIALTWRTESETENQGYLLERRVSNEGEWTEIASYLDNDALTGHGSTTESHTYQYVDDAVQTGVTYAYRLGDVDYNSNITWHKKVEVKAEVEEKKIPAQFGLEKAYPNPFNPEITLHYGLIEDAHTTLLIYDMRGQLIETLQSGNISAGNHSVIWQPMNISTGMYIVRLQSGSNTNMQKIVYVK